MMGTFRGTVLPSNIPPGSLPDKFSEFVVSKIEKIRSSLDPDRPFPSDTVEFSGTPFAEFQLIRNDCVKEVLEYSATCTKCAYEPVEQNFVIKLCQKLRFDPIKLEARQMNCAANKTVCNNMQTCLGTEIYLYAD